MAGPGEGEDDLIHDQPDEDTVADAGEDGLTAEEGKARVDGEKGGGEAKSDEIVQEHAIDHHIGAAGGGLWSEYAAGDEAKEARGLVISSQRVANDRARCVECAGDEGGEEQSLPENAAGMRRA